MKNLIPTPLLPKFKGDDDKPIFEVIVQTVESKIVTEYNNFKCLPKTIVQSIKSKTIVYYLTKDNDDKFYFVDEAETVVSDKCNIKYLEEMMSDLESSTKLSSAYKIIDTSRSDDDFGYKLIVTEISNNKISYQIIPSQQTISAINPHRHFLNQLVGKECVVEDLESLGEVIDGLKVYLTAHVVEKDINGSKRYSAIINLRNEPMQVVEISCFHTSFYNILLETKGALLKNKKFPRHSFGLENFISRYNMKNISQFIRCINALYNSIWYLYELETRVKGMGYNGRNYDEFDLEISLNKTEVIKFINIALLKKQKDITYPMNKAMNAIKILQSNKKK